MAAEPLTCTYSPLRGNRRLSQFVEQRLGLFEIGGVEAFGEPGVDRGEQFHRTSTGPCTPQRPQLVPPTQSGNHNTRSEPHRQRY